MAPTDNTPAETSPEPAQERLVPAGQGTGDAVVDLGGDDAASGENGGKEAKEQFKRRKKGKNSTKAKATTAMSKHKAGKEPFAYRYADGIVRTGGQGAANDGRLTLNALDTSERYCDAVAVGWVSK